MSKLETILKALPSIIWSVVGLSCILLAFQASSFIQHTDMRMNGAGGLLPAAASTVAGVGSQAQISLDNADARVSVSLDNLDRQLAMVGPVVGSAKPVLDNFAAVGSKLGNTVDRINAPCAPGPCGTIADVGKTLNTVRGTFGQIEIAANHEDRNLTTLDAQENQLYADFHGTATRMNTGLDTFDGLLANPNLALTMKNIGDMTSTASQVEAKLARCTLHPTIACQLKSNVIFGAQVGGYLLH
jgi:hypothetical protein